MCRGRAAIWAGPNAAEVHDSELLASYPSLRPEDINAALAYAAELAREGTIDLPLELSA